ncbi:CBO0543 family protein [Neobacillus endophyticus]|uniref:CBO0543 family protein n=1 Tax=Neobacillus endophyticus TaxID=2738405 RepID=UPI001C268B05|nr:CBO0543 family protein [Neobacillus endophyticus]
MIWRKLKDKQRLMEILFYGILIMISAIVLDNLGTDLMWWVYPTKLFQMFPPLIPADLALVPCLMMVVYQWTKTWKAFLIYNFLLSLFMAYLGEPFFIWLKLYQLIHWKLFYSLLYYNISGTLARWLVLKVKI